MLKLWLSGVWQALHVHRCIVACVLDSTGRVRTRFWHSCILHGLLYGSVQWHQRVLTPLVWYLMEKGVMPHYGSLAANITGAICLGSFHILWLAPLYVVTLVVVGIQWNQEMANLALSAQEPGQPPVQKPPQPASASGLLDVAEVMYKVLFFLIFQMEIMLMRYIPHVGPYLNILFLSWLYAYQCHEYKWTVQKKSLKDMLGYVERRWAFFAGFGYPCAAATNWLSFYTEAALRGVLTSMFVLVACRYDMDEVLGGDVARKPQGRLPIFALAYRPTNMLCKMFRN